jgi:hypothetical protein
MKDGDMGLVKHSNYVQDEKGLVKIGARVPGEDWRTLDRYIPYGMKQHILTAVIRLVIKAVKEGGQVTVGAIIAGQYRLVPDDYHAAGVPNLNDPTGARKKREHLE